MTQEYKELLLIDLCTRLPYGVIVINPRLEGGYPYKLSPYKGAGKYIDSSFVDDTKIYLRPMSSMTEKEVEEYFSICTGSIRGDMIAKIDFYIKHHFDFRLTSEGLSMIEVGLALEAPEGMYKHFGDMDVVVTSVEHKDKL